MITELNANHFTYHANDYFPDLTCGEDYKHGANSNSNFIEKIVTYYDEIYDYIYNTDNEKINDFNMVLNYLTISKSNCLSVQSQVSGKYLLMPEFLIYLYQTTPLYEVRNNCNRPNPRW